MTVGGLYPSHNLHTNITRVSPIFVNIWRYYLYKHVLSFCLLAFRRVPKYIETEIFQRKFLNPAKDETTQTKTVQDSFPFYFWGWSPESAAWVFGFSGNPKRSSPAGKGEA